MPIFMKPAKNITVEEKEYVKNLRDEAITKLLEMLEYIYSTASGPNPSKYSLMGPAGKLINLCKNTGEIDWGKVRGYIANVMRMGQTFVPTVALTLVDEVCEILSQARQKLDGLEWLKYLEGLDSELFFQIYKSGKEKKDEYIIQQFQEYLTNEFKTLKNINAKLSTKFQSLTDIGHPNTIEKKEIAEDFWKKFQLKKKKKNKEEK